MKELPRILQRVHDAWRAVEALRVDDPRASKGMARLSKALYEASEYIEAHRWKGDE